MKERIGILAENVEAIDKKLVVDDKLFWKRTNVKTEKHSISPRIYHPAFYNVNRHKIRQSLIPNSIHAYDAAVIHLTIQICKKLNINVLPIHDSIGCDPLAVPLVKIIFKIANIHILNLNRNRRVFPFKLNEFVLNDEDFNTLRKEILKSKDFFR